MLFKSVTVFVAVTVFHSAWAERVDLQLVGQQGDYYFFTLPTSRIQDQTYVTKVATQFCATKTYCFLGFWRAGKNAPKRLPITDRQAAEQIATYRQNLHTGSTVLLWNCKQFPKEPSSKCFDG